MAKQDGTSVDAQSGTLAEWSVDFLGEDSRQVTATEVTQLRLGDNILSSYSHSSDFLAETLQNATDAVDTRLEEEPDAPARIDIRFDAAKRTITVLDTGIGMSRDDIRVVLAPNVTLKAGLLARSGGRRSRGEKGVGLTFLALACDYLAITTCDGNQRLDITVVGGNRWVRSDGKAAKPIARVREHAPDQRSGSTRYTEVVLGNLALDQFDQDLFSLDEEALVWLLRTRTAVGHTGNLLRQAQGKKPQATIDVSLAFVSRDGAEALPRNVPYIYASPEELVPRHLVKDFREVAPLSPAAQFASLRGSGLRYVKRVVSASNREIDVYVFVIDGREMMGYSRVAQDEGKFFPDEWQGFYLATRNMPTGISINPEVIQPRGYERRMFALIQFDGLALDLGRKTPTGRTMRMLRDAILEVWSRDLQAVVPRIQPTTVLDDESPQSPGPAGDGTPTPDRPDAASNGAASKPREPGSTLAEARARLAQAAAEDQVQRVAEAILQTVTRRALAAPDLHASIPYLKEPTGRSDVVAVFHELLASHADQLPILRPVKTGLYKNDDSLMYVGEPNGVAPVHVLVGLDARDIVQDLERDDGSGRTAQFGVLWKLDLPKLSRRGIEVRTAEPGPDGATHELLLRGVGDREAFRVIVLGELLVPRESGEEP